MCKKLFAVLYLIGSVILCGCMFFYGFQRNVFQSDAFENNMNSIRQSGRRVPSYLRAFYGWCNRLFHPHEFVLRKGRVVVRTEDGFMDGFCLTDFDVTEAAAKLAELQQVCHELGSDFAYISYPSKSDITSTFSVYGIDANTEEIREAFLRELSVRNIPLLDLRKLLEQDGYTKRDVFYKTDHHWKTWAGLYAARHITFWLNQTFDYKLRCDLLAESKFTQKNYPNLWLGETGRKPTHIWVGALDDFTEITPTYETELRVGKKDGDYNRKGDFSLFIDKSGYDGSKNLYSYSAHYSYGKNLEPPTWVHNDRVTGKKILIIKDSFSMVVIPFLALATSDICVWDMGPKTKDGLYQYIQENHVDIVLVAYTDFFQARMYAFN